MSTTQIWELIIFNTFINLNFLHNSFTLSFKWFFNSGHFPLASSCWLKVYVVYISFPFLLDLFCKQKICYFIFQGYQNSYLLRYSFVPIVPKCSTLDVKKTNLEIKKEKKKMNIRLFEFSACSSVVLTFMHKFGICRYFRSTVQNNGAKVLLKSLININTNPRI